MVAAAAKGLYFTLGHAGEMSKEWMDVVKERGWVREEAFAQLMEGKIIAFKGEKWAPRKVRYVSPFNRRWWEKWINICTEWVIALGWFYLWGHTHNTHNGVFKKKWSLIWPRRQTWSYSQTQPRNCNHTPVHMLNLCSLKPCVRSTCHKFAVFFWASAQKSAQASTGATL